MDKKVILVIACLMFAASFAFSGAALAQEADVAFTVARFVTAEDVVDREPVGVAETFPASTDTVYCFLEARDIPRDTEVSMVWYLGEEEMAMVTLLLRESHRWRTYSSKRIAGRTGQWSVALKDAQGNTIKTAEFTVE